MKIEVDQLPEELARALFEALRLQIRYNRDTHTATCRVTLTGTTITAASRTAHDAAVTSLEDARQRRQQPERE
jgi:site-specific DNA recombinase